jgi:hypothetical protein
METQDYMENLDDAVVKVTPQNVKQSMFRKCHVSCSEGIWAETVDKEHRYLLSIHFIWMLLGKTVTLIYMIL